MPSFLLVISLSLIVVAESTTSPNVIFIFADDLGYNDVGYQGSDILTPFIDHLAETGVKLEQHYGQPMCAPSRAAFMSGRYPIHTGFHEGNIQQGELWGLDTSEYTVGQLFQHYGYYTHAIGKWHLGWRTWNHTPVMRGFNTFLGFYFCAHDHFSYDCGSLKVDDDTSRIHRSIRRLQRRVNRENGKPPWYGLAKKKKDKPKFFDLRSNYINREGELVDEVRYDLAGQYSAHVFTDEAMTKIKQRAPDQPFFLYLSYMNVHAPYQARKEDLDRYTAHMEPYASKKRRNYAAMMSTIDEGIGNITSLLKSEGIYEDTLIVFASDNGANVGFCKATDEFDKEGKQPGSNYPLRGGKRSLFEGGIRLVSFVHGAGIIKKPGVVSGDLVHLVDWFTTFRDLLEEYNADEGRDPPAHRPKDGISFWKTLREGLPGRRRSFLVNIDTRGGINCGPQRPFKAIRSGSWKLIVGGGGPPMDWFHPYADVTRSPELRYYELYHIENDPYETNNIAELHETIVLQLLTELAEHEHTVVPSLRRRKQSLTSRIWNSTVPMPLQASQSNEALYTGRTPSESENVPVLQIIRKP